MTDILNQIDAVLADVTSCLCGCGAALSQRGPSPWFLNEAHQARWDQRQAKGKSCIEQEAVEAGPATILTLDDVAVAGFEMRHRSLEDRIAYLAEQRERHVAMGAPAAWLEAFDALVADQCPPARPAITLAEMNAASAAVRARQEAGARTCPTCRNAINPPYPCLYCDLTRANQEAALDLVASTPLVDAALESDEAFDTELRAINDRLVAALDEQIPVAPWWRRMLGGGTR